jgi:hypothetical protein
MVWQAYSSHTQLTNAWCHQLFVSHASRDTSELYFDEKVQREDSSWLYSCRKPTGSGVAAIRHFGNISRACTTLKYSTATPHLARNRVNICMGGFAQALSSQRLHTTASSCEPMRRAMVSDSPTPVTASNSACSRARNVSVAMCITADGRAHRPTRLYTASEVGIVSPPTRAIRLLTGLLISLTGLLSANPQNIAVCKTDVRYVQLTSGNHDRLRYDRSRCVQQQDHLRRPNRALRMHGFVTKLSD